MRKLLQINQITLTQLKRKELIEKCSTSLLNSLSKSEQFKIIKNVISQTIYLWNDFTKFPGIIEN